MTVALREPATIRNTTSAVRTTTAASSSPTTVDGECAIAGDKKAFARDNENVAALQNSSDTDSSSSLTDNNKNNNEEEDHEQQQNHRVMMQEEPLKYKRDNPDDSTTTQNDATYHTKRRKQQQRTNDDGDKKKRHCEFNETVKVVPIPMHTEYSSYVRQRLWSNSLEIQQNAARNTLEFASEGWNWRSVILDESMYICDKTGEMIHPIHYEPYSFIVALDDDDNNNNNNHESTRTTTFATAQELTAGVAATESATTSMTEPTPTKDTTS